MILYYRRASCFSSGVLLVGTVSIPTAILGAMLDSIYASRRPMLSRAVLVERWPSPCPESEMQHRRVPCESSWPVDATPEARTDTSSLMSSTETLHPTDSPACICNNGNQMPGKSFRVRPRTGAPAVLSRSGYRRGHLLSLKTGS